MATSGYQRPGSDYARLNQATEKRKKNWKVVTLILFPVLILLLLILWKSWTPICHVFDGTQKEQSDSSPVSESSEARKNIYDRNFRELAVSFQQISIYARPLELENIRESVKQLSSVLDLDEDELYADLKAERSYTWLGRHVAPSLAEKVAGMNLPGVYFFKGNERFYPNGNSAAHVLGFVKDEQGLAGMELYYNSLLRNSVSPKEEVSKPDSGLSAHLVLTLDLRIQNLLEGKIEKLLRETGAKQGMAAVMDVENGEILALANLPAFDPNRFWQSSADSLENRMVTQTIYPGGLNRLFQLATFVRFGRVKKEEAGEVFTGKPLSPRMKKKWKKERNPLPWQLVDDKFLFSPELAELNEGQASLDELAGFAAELGFGGGRYLNLFTIDSGEEEGEEGLGGPVFLGENESATGLSVLSVFSSLVNGGKQVNPSLLLSLVTEEGLKQAEHKTNESLVEFKGEMSKQFINFLEDRSPPGSTIFFAESLLAPPFSEQMEVRQASEDEEVEGAEQANRFVKQATLLGMAPLAHPRLTLFLALDDARINMKSYSPLRRSMDDFLRQVLGMSHAVPEIGAQPSSMNQEELYRKWLALQDSAVVFGQDEDVRSGRMPDLRGYSLRKALQVLQPYNMQIRVNGSGHVVSQEPQPGKALSRKECILTLEMAL